MSHKRLDLTGERYGILTVIKEVAQIGTKRRWLCRCDCGNETIVKMDSLRSGHTESCGCLRKINVSKANLKDLTGKKFGKLTVIKQEKSKPGLPTAFWLCKCDCGNDPVISSSNLMSGHTRSCGCIGYHKFAKKEGITKESCFEDMIAIYKEYGIIKQSELNKKLPSYSLNTLRRRFDNMRVGQIWDIVKKQVEEKENG